MTTLNDKPSSMRRPGRGPSLVAAAVIVCALSAGTSALAFPPVVSHVTGDGADTASGNQAETGTNASQISPTTMVETVVFNDDGGPHVTYTTTDRFVTSGYNAVGWAFRVRSGSGPDPAWTRNQVVMPAGIGALWGDPSIASNPAAPNAVFFSTLAVFQDQFPPSGTIQGSVAVDGCSPRSPISGACVARSLDGGQTFPTVDCFRDTSALPGLPCATGGHFYDGSSTAVVQTASGFAAFAAFNDVFQNRIAVWVKDDVNDAAGFHMDPTVVGPTGPLGDVGEEGLHPRLRAQGDVLWKMVPGAGANLLKVNQRDRSATFEVVADDAVSQFVVNFGSDSFGARRVRTGPQYAFDVGSNENGDAEMRFVYIAKDPMTGLFRVQGGFCTPGLSVCRRPADWRSPAFSVPAFFHPAIKFGRDPVSGAIDWKVTFEAETSTGDAVLVSADLVRRDLVPGSTASTVKNGLALNILNATAEPPCPDTRNGDPSGGYWGDYDDMTFDPLRRSFVRAFADSTSGCPSRLAFTSANVHVSALEIPIRTGAVDVALTSTASTIFDDHDAPFGNDQIDHPQIDMNCSVDPLHTTDVAQFAFCEDADLLWEITMTCTLVGDQTVSVNVSSTLDEAPGDGDASGPDRNLCGSFDHREDSRSVTATLAAGASSTSLATFDLVEENDPDEDHVHLEATVTASSSP